MAWGGARPGSGPKKKQKLPAVASPSILQRVALKISDTALVIAGARPAKNPFAPPTFPPGVIPKEYAAGMAMDEDPNISAFVSWASSSFGSAFAEGIIFLGYPYLTELAQRAEYRVLTETTAEDMTRKWIRLQAKGDVDKTERIQALDDELKRLDVCAVFRQMAEFDGYFGRGHLYIDLAAGEDREELKTPIGNGLDEISRGKMEKGGFLALRAIEPVWTYPTRYNSNDPLRNDWYRPNEWFVMGKQVHASRLLRFVGREVPDLLKPAYAFGGLSMSQMAKPYVDNWLRTRQSVADLVHAFSVMVLKTNLATQLQNDGALLFNRAELFNRLRDNKGLMVVDKDTEDFANVSVPLGSLDQLQAQSQEHMAAVGRIPIVKLLGIQPAGLNASSKGEIDTYDDTIAARQDRLFGPNLHVVIRFAQLRLWGEVDPDITFAWEPLRSLDPKEIAEKQKIEAETDVILIDGGVIHPEEARKRVAGDPDTPYAGLDIEDVPEPPEPEEPEIGGGEAGGEGAVGGG